MPVIVGANSPLDPTPYPPGTPLIGYDNVVSTANVTSSSALAGFPITNIANPATHLLWKGGVNTGNEVITIAPGGRTVDYIAFAGHNFGSSQIPVTIADTGSSPPVTLVASTLLTNDTAAIFRFAPGAYGQISITLDLSNVPDD